MRKIREVLRLKHSGGLSIRAIARACSVGKETVREYLCRASEAGIGWPLPEGLGDEELEKRLFPSVLKEAGKRTPDWALVHQELRKKGVTRQLLWTEYKEEDPSFWDMTPIFRTSFASSTAHILNIDGQSYRLKDFNEMIHGSKKEKS